jgi:hypothetical protein
LAYAATAASWSTGFDSLNSVMREMVPIFGVMEVELSDVAGSRLLMGIGWRRGGRFKWQSQSNHTRRRHCF